MAFSVFLLSLPSCCIGISSSIFSAAFCGLLTPFEYWIYRGLIPNSKGLFLDGTMCTFLLQLMLLSPRGLCQRTLVLRFTTQNSSAGQVMFNLFFPLGTHGGLACGRLWAQFCIPLRGFQYKFHMPTCKLNPTPHPDSYRGCS